MEVRGSSVRPSAGQANEATGAALGKKQRQKDLDILLNLHFFRAGFSLHSPPCSTLGGKHSESRMLSLNMKTFTFIIGWIITFYTT